MKKIMTFMSMIILIALVACSSPKEEETVQQVEESEESVESERPVIRIGWQNSGFPSPFTFGTTGPGGFLRHTLIFDSLTWKDESGVIPWIAKEWTISDDGLTYTFMLEENVTFHDGEKLTAEDVAFTYEYFAQHPFPWNADIRYVKEVQVVDEYEVNIVLNERYAPFITEIAGMIPILPKHIWENVDQPLEYTEPESLIGTGPFILEQYDAESGNYLYVPNESFFKGKVNVKELQFLAVENRILSLQNNEIDAGMTFIYSDVVELEKQGFDVIQSEPTGSAVRIVFNLDHPQLKDNRLRQAIAYALNRSDIAEKATGGGEPIVGSAGIIPPDSPWYNEEVKQYSYDIEKAEQLLDELGYEKNAQGIRDGLTLSVIVSSDSVEAQLMQEMLKQIGIRLDIQQVDQATFTTAMGENKYDMAITGHIGLSGDPDFLRLWFSGEASNTYAARGKSFEHEQFHQLANQQVGLLNEDERKAVVDEMQNILAEELPTLVLYHRPFYFLHDKDQFDRWFNTYGGIADGIPLWENKVAFIDE